MLKQIFFYKLYINCTKTFSFSPPIVLCRAVLSGAQRQRRRRWRSCGGCRYRRRYRSWRLAQQRPNLARGGAGPFLHLAHTEGCGGRAHPSHQYRGGGGLRQWPPLTADGPVAGILTAALSVQEFPCLFEFHLAKKGKGREGFSLKKYVCKSFLTRDGKSLTGICIMARVRQEFLFNFPDRKIELKCGQSSLV